jgi:hypothetical protein
MFLHRWKRTELLRNCVWILVACRMFIRDVAMSFFLQHCSVERCRRSSKETPRLTDMWQAGRIRLVLVLRPLGNPHFHTSVYMTKSHAEENTRGVKTNRNTCNLVIKNQDPKLTRKWITHPEKKWRTENVSKHVKILSRSLICRGKYFTWKQLFMWQYSLGSTRKRFDIVTCGPT